MIKVAFCDDEAKILDDLSVKIKKEFKKLNCEIDLYTAENSINFLEYLKNNPVDILFLDIDMPIISGMDIAEVLLNSEINTLLVFITGQDALVYKSFKYHSFGFIRKTYFDEEISGVVKGLVQELQKNSDAFSFKIGGSFNRIKLKDIIYFESESNYLNLHTKGTVYKFRINWKISERIILIDKGSMVFNGSFDCIKYSHASINSLSAELADKIPDMQDLPVTKCLYSLC